MNEETVFHLARQKSANERAAFLEVACAGDADMRQRLEVLLEADDGAGSFLQTPVSNQLATGAFQSAGGQEAASSTHCLDGATPEVKSEATLAETSPSKPEGLGFLAPGTRSGSIGRLGHYEILEVIGKGGFGTVLKAFDDKLHRIVAIKVLSPAYADNGSARKRFIREAQTAAAVKNEHVVAIYDVEKDSQPPYLAMEMIEGISLQDKIDKQGPLGIREILRIGMQMAEGLAAAHKQGLVHRDIKPANILLENGVERVKITDFGLARAVDDASVTQSGTVAGTPMFMSPEQAEGLQVDHRSDLFSLGTVLYAMCTGHPPFRASGTHAVLKRVIDASPRPICEINSEIPDWLCDIIAKLHAKKPEDRFQTAKQVAELLGQRLADVQAGRAIQSEPIQMPGPDAVSPAAPAKKQSRVPFGTKVTALTMGLVGLGLVSMAYALPKPSPAGTLCAMAGAALGLIAGTILVMALVRAKQWGKLAMVLPAALLSIASVPIWDYFLLGGASVIVTADDPALKVSFFGRGPEMPTALHVTGPAFNKLSLPTGTYKVAIQCGAGRKLELVSMAHWPQPRTFAGGEDEYNFEMKIDGGQHPTLVIRTAAIRPSRETDRAPDDQPDWVQLFNGKDLTGWKTHPNHAGAWTVVDKAIVNKGPMTSYLFSERNDLENFHLRAELKVSRPSDSGLFFRSGFELHPTHRKFPLGYEANVVAGWRPATGSLFAANAADAGSEGRLLAGVDKELTQLNHWFTLEIIARDNHIIIMVDGKKVVDCVDANSTYRRGHLALQAYGINEPRTAIHCRKIEIKELPPSHKDDKQRMQGHWVAESVDNGRQLPKDFVALFNVTIDGNKVTWRTPALSPTESGEQTVREPSVFHLNETVTPKQIDMIDGDRHGQFGIYRFDGDRLVMCMGEDTVKDRPKEFSSKGGKSRLVIVFKRKVLQLPAGKQKRTLSILVPAYFDPVGEGLQHWDRLIAATRHAPIVAIVNVDSGPGKAADANYTKVLKRAKKAGATLLGYVSTSYGKRPAPNVKSEVDRWIEFYPQLDGIFFDEQAAEATHVDYYVDLHEYVHKRKQRKVVITNPGAVCAETYVSRPAAEILCLVEATTDFGKVDLPAWLKQYPPSRFAALAYGVTAAEKLEEFVSQAVAKQVGYLYFTDATGNNPWGRLPRYWDRLVEVVEGQNRADGPP